MNKDKKIYVILSISLFLIISIFILFQNNHFTSLETIQEPIKEEIVEKTPKDIYEESCGELKTKEQLIEYIKTINISDENKEKIIESL